MDEEGRPAGRQVEMPISDSLDLTREWQASDVLEPSGTAAAGAAAVEMEDVFEPAPGLEGTGPSVPVASRFLRDMLGASEEVTEDGRIVTITVDEEAEAHRAAATGVETVLENGQDVVITVDEVAEAERIAAVGGATVMEGGRAISITVDETAEAEQPIGGTEEKGERRPAERKYPKPKYGRRWVGGTLVGTVLGVAACLAVALFVPETWRQLMGVGRQLTGKEATEDRSGPAKVARSRRTWDSWPTAATSPSNRLRARRTVLPRWLPAASIAGFSISRGRRSRNWRMRESRRPWPT